MKIQLWVNTKGKTRYFNYLDCLVYLNKLGQVEKIEAYNQYTREWFELEERCVVETFQGRLRKLHADPHIEMVWEWEE